MYRRLGLVAAGAALTMAAMALALAAPPGRQAAALTNCATTSEGLDSGEQALFEMVNMYRQQNGAAAVKSSPNLNRAAAFIVEDMKAKGYFNHFEPSGRTPFQRAADCGYPSQNVGENLAISFSGGGAMTLWKGSPGHNANMLMTRWKVVGVAQAGGYWALVFGATDDTGTAGPPVPPATSPTASPTPTVTPIPTPGHLLPSVVPIRRAMLQMVASE